MQQKEKSLNYKKYFSFYDHLSDSEKEMLERHTNTVTYSKGENIHNGSDVCKGLMVVKSGSLRTYLLSEEGREITLYRIFDGDVCVLSASCVIENITFEVFVDAEEDSEVIILSAAAFSKLMSSNIYVECYAYKLATTSFSNVMWAIQQILFMSFDRRLALFLSEEIKKTGGDTISLTHEQVAKYMGSAREVVSRMLKYFVSEKIVELSRGGIKIIDMQKLERLV
ncbi:MAG: Crp/Fnr family transcriptional regulator [Clostridiales bacterium GWF2_36_10]|nr:MAG: Crp/Fnr family transcriptional regulator [Clostridiales bacterium GWF2_36_10]HAN20626.1 Crp/Fnr family transcriptional regulator [Clostridiales bacterium]